MVPDENRNSKDEEVAKIMQLEVRKQPLINAKIVLWICNF